MKTCGAKRSEICRGSLAAVLTISFFSGEAPGVLGRAGNWEPQSLHCVADGHLSFAGLWVGAVKPNRAFV